MKADLGKLLIVEDDVSLTIYLREIFEPYFEIRIAHDGQAGYDLARTFYPDCIISDVRMPRLSGLNMLKKIRGTHGLETVGVILLSVLSEQKDRIRGYDHLADLYFTKPFDAEELISATIGLVMMRQQMKQIYSTAPATDSQTIGKGLSDENQKFLGRISEIVEAHIEEYDLKVETISAKLEVSKRQLERRLKDLEGVTPAEYIRQVRLEHARKLLASGTVSTIKDLASSVGFRDTKTFSQRFTAYFGYSPSSML